MNTENGTAQQAQEQAQQVNGNSDAMQSDKQAIYDKVNGLKNDVSLFNEKWGKGALSCFLVVVGKKDGCTGILGGTLDLVASMGALAVGSKGLFSVLNCLVECREMLRLIPLMHHMENEEKEANNG